MNITAYKINLEDISQIILGASVMAVPIAFSEELWRLGETLPKVNLIGLFCLSLFIQAAYTYFSIFQGTEKKIGVISVRVLVNYFLTFGTVAVILLALNRLDFAGDTQVGLYRVIILTFPASLGAVIVDGFDKEVSDD